MAPKELGKNSDLLRGYIDSIRKGEKVDLYGPAGTPIFEELWLMSNADAPSTLASGREGRGQKKKTQQLLCLTFSCPGLKCKFYFIIPALAFISNLLIESIRGASVWSPSTIVVAHLPCYHAPQCPTLMPQFFLTFKGVRLVERLPRTDSQL